MDATIDEGVFDTTQEKILTRSFQTDIKLYSQMQMPIFLVPVFFSPGSRGFGSEENLLQFLACQNISSRSLLQIHYKHQTNLQILLKLQGPCNHLLNI